MQRALDWIRRRMLVLLLGAYVLGALAPSIGEALREVQIARVPALGASGFSVPMAMLGLLLFIAGLGARRNEIVETFRRPKVLLLGLLANATYPTLFVAASSALLPLLGSHSIDEDSQNVLVGLAIVGAMPIAGASVAWSHNTEGNVALSLGLVWGSTFLSPILSPIVLDVMSTFVRGEYAEDLQEIARQRSAPFFALVVVVPTVLGIAVQAVFGRARIAHLLPGLQLLNLVDLLGLNYVNASISLPDVIARPEPDFIVLVAVLTTVMCICAFAIGWWIPRRFHARREDQTAMMFGLGMSNNGSGLVLAQATLVDRPRVLVAIIVYNVIQQIGAGIVDAHRRRAPSARPSLAPSAEPVRARPPPAEPERRPAG